MHFVAPTKLSRRVWREERQRGDCYLEVGKEEMVGEGGGGK